MRRLQSRRRCGQRQGPAVRVIIAHIRLTVISPQTFISALVLNLAIAGIEFGAFLLIRNGFPRIYQPRVDLPAEDKRSKPLPRNPFHLIPAILFANDEDIVRTNGLEAYLFVRFLKLMVWIFAPIAVVTWAIVGTEAMYWVHRC